jgi:hypothetical protein
VSDEELTAEQIMLVTATVDIEAPPPPHEPTAHFIFGTNQALPAAIVAPRNHQGLAPLVIVTGGVNRHNGIVEGQQFLRLLTDDGVPATAIRCEDRSATTWQNVEFALPHLREAIAAGLSLTVVSKWYHLRSVHVLRTFLPELGSFHAISWEPVYSGTAITRQNWPDTDERRMKVIRELDEVARKVSDGTYRPTRRVDSAWR